MGVYYSGLYDWSWNETGIRNYFTSLVNGRQSPETVGYMDGHVNDLIQRYAPAVLWNDVGYVTHPPWERFSLTGLWDEYYAAVPDGAIDDRWYAVPTPRTIDYVVLTTVSRFFARAGTAWIADLIDKALDKDRPVDGLKLPTSAPHDFRTYEYEVPGEIQSDKWELVRGIGLSFCYNGNEEHDQWLSLPDLTWIFVDVVSKNGNLLLNVGPKADGSLQVHEVVLLEGFGRWMSTYGDALYDSKPWAAIPHDTYLRTSQIAALPVRFTEKDGVLNVFFRANTSGKELFIESVQPAREASVSLWMGTGLPRRPIAWRTHPEGLWVTLPSDLPASPVQCLTIDPMPSWNGPKSYAQGGSLGYRSQTVLVAR
jgi:alpha-L-fucosidase